jgi:hypothetical protein
VTVADVELTLLDVGFVITAENGEPAFGQLAPSLGRVTPLEEFSISDVPLPSGMTCGVCLEISSALIIQTWEVALLKKKRFPPESAKADPKA